MAQSSDGDMHSDFQPQVKATPAASVSEQIQQDIKDHKVFVYMKVIADCIQTSKKPKNLRGGVCARRATLRLPCVASVTWSARS